MPNPTALITGASRGIGRGIALELATMGWDLVLGYARNQAAAEDAAKACEAAAAARNHSIRAFIHRADIALAANRDGLVEQARQVFNRLDLLVNNAGAAPEVRADLLETTEESFDRVLAINLKGPFFLTQAVARWMAESARSSQAANGAAAGAAATNAATVRSYRPKIVTITSISAYTASVNRGEYCVAKAGLAMLTPLFASRLADLGIGVFEIRPGVVATDMTSAVREKYDALIASGLTPIRRWGTPDDVAKAVHAIASDLLPFSTGEVLNVDGGFHLRRL